MASYLFMLPLVSIWSHPIDGYLKVILLIIKKIIVDAPLCRRVNDETARFRLLAILNLPLISLIIMSDLVVSEVL